MATKETKGTTKARRWIIPTRMSCARYCGGKAKGKIEDAVSGTAVMTCAGCGFKFKHHLSDFKERRPCARCKHVYDVTVRLWPGREDEPRKEHWNDTCSICRLEISANNHLATGMEFRRRAAALRAEQKRKKLAAAVKSTTLLEVDEHGQRKLKSESRAAGELEAARDLLADAQSPEGSR